MIVDLARLLVFHWDIHVIVDKTCRMTDLVIFGATKNRTDFMSFVKEIFTFERFWVLSSFDIADVQVARLGV
jgi:hypothetical protein